MDVHSLPEEGEDVAADSTSTLGVEELPSGSQQETELAQEDAQDDGTSTLGVEELPSGIQQETELAQEDAQDETAKIGPKQSGSILRCLQRIFKKGKRGRRRHRRTFYRVPDISPMDTIWEADESIRERRESAVEGAEFLLESWRNTIDYYNSYKEDFTMRNSFFRLLAVLSKTIDWPNMPNFFVQTFASDAAGVMVEMIKEETFSITVCLQAMGTVTDMSKRHVVKAMDSHKRRVLLKTFVKIVFSLPIQKTSQALGKRAQDTQALFTQTVQTFIEMLNQLMLENPVPAELEGILQLMDSWMLCRAVSLRARAVWISAQLLTFVATKVKLHEAPPFTKLGHLAAVLAICCGDSSQEVSSNAAGSVRHLIAIMRHQKFAQLGEKNGEVAEQTNQNLLSAWSPTELLNNPSRIVELFGVYFSPGEWTDFILTLLDSLTHCSYENCQPAAERLLSAVMNSGGMKAAKAEDIVDGVCSRLDIIWHSRSQALMKDLVGSLAGQAEHLDAVISGLLEHSFPSHRNSAELWRFLSAHPALAEPVMEKLVDILQSNHTSEHWSSRTSAAATRAVHEMLSISKFSLASMNALERLYPQLLMVLLVEVHFCVGRSLPEDEVSGRESIHTSSALEAVKMLLISVGCHDELTVMEKDEGWDLLRSPQDHLLGVGVLARALLACASPELKRLLEHVISLLNGGDEKRRLTTMTFFVELLPSKEAMSLPHPDTLHRLKEWTKNPCPAFRSLGLKGLSVLATQPEKVEEVKALLPIILWGSKEREDGCALEAIAAVRNFLNSLEGSELNSVARRLIPLFSAGRPQERVAAITLFTELLTAVKRREKRLVKEEVTRSLVPLLLHLQDEDPDVRKRCQKAVSRCFQLLGWALPIQINSRKAWHDHPQLVDNICRQSVLKLKNTSDSLLQCLDHLQSPQVSIQRAAATFLGCTVRRSDPAMVGQEKMEMILESLDGLQRDPDPSVRVSASQAAQQVQDSGRNRSPQNTGARLRNLFCCLSAQDERENAPREDLLDESGPSQPTSGTQEGSDFPCGRC